MTPNPTKTDNKLKIRYQALLQPSALNSLDTDFPLMNTITSYGKTKAGADTFGIFQ
ncbi:MAG: hypothetical protein AAF662_06045 [Pseudomonadota bacterium]